MNKLVSVITGIFLLLTIGLTRAADISPQLQAAMDAAEPGDKLGVIINLMGDIDLAALNGLDRAAKRSKLVTDLKAAAAVAQQPIIDALQQQGISNARSLWAINALATELPVGAINGFSNNPKIESILLDIEFQAKPTGPAVPSIPGWNLDAVRAPELWSLGFKGKNTVIASMDSGVDADHPDLAAQWRGGNNSWYDPSGQHATPYDASGHGTQVMGLAVGGGASGTAIGTAPEAEWIAVKIFNDSGVATLSGVHAGFQWLLDPDGNPKKNDMPDVVNNSWAIGSIGGCSLEFQEDINVLRAADIAVVFSAGNYGSNAGTSVSPANNPGSLAVGAVDENLVIANTSSRGPSACDGAIYPPVSAPGVNVQTTDLTFGGVVPDSYAWVSGTSFAAPHVTGAIALLKQAMPDATLNDIEQAITQGALDRGVTGADNDYGYGVMDVMEAYYALSAAPTEPPPEPPPPGENTITITLAEYNIARDRLTVEATSGLGGDALLVLEGYGDMVWSKRNAVWSKTVNKAGGDPGVVTVSGQEGSVSINTTAK
jgi:bacillopeptidase F